MIQWWAPSSGSSSATPTIILVFAIFIQTLRSSIKCTPIRCNQLFSCCAIGGYTCYILFYQPVYLSLSLNHLHHQLIWWLLSPECMELPINSTNTLILISSPPMHVISGQFLWHQSTIIFHLFPGIGLRLIHLKKSLTSRRFNIFGSVSTFIQIIFGYGSGPNCWSKLDCKYGMFFFASIHKNQI